MSTYLRKCIDIAPTALTNPFPPPPNDYVELVKQPWWEKFRATTTHARILADWPSLQPSATPTPEAELVQRLDRQITAAYNDGLKIILLPYRFPRWTNGTDRFPAGSATDEDWFPQDRVARLADYVAWREGRAMRPSYKAHPYGMPTDGFKPGSEWAKYVEFLWDRYASFITAFEVVNEPNLQIWPQRSTVVTDDINVRWGTAGTDLVIAQAVADMMVTVDAISRRHGDPLVLLAPSCSDTQILTPRTVSLSHTNRYLGYDAPFAEALLGALDARGFVADDRWVWSYHNYSDVERNLKQVVDLRRVLAERGWAGRRLDGGPEVWCTEGGCRVTGTTLMNRMAQILGHAPGSDEVLQLQAAFIKESLSRHHYAKGDGAGVGMLTQYTIYNESFNAGIFTSTGTPRPSFDAWCSVPEYHAAPVQRAAWRPQL